MVTYNGSVSFSTVKNKMDVMNAYDFCMYAERNNGRQYKKVDGEMVDEFEYFYLKTD